MNTVFEIDGQHDQQAGFVRAGDNPRFRQAMDSLRRTIDAMPPDATPPDPVLTNRQEISRARFNSSGLPPAYRGMDFPRFVPHSPDHRMMLARVEGWVSEFPSRKNLNRCNLLLWSKGTGSGKTHLAVAALQAIMDTWGTQCIYADCPELMASLRNEWGDENTSAWAEHQVLLLDDIGAERGTGVQTERLIVLLRKRMTAQKPTIITTNESFPVQLEKYLSPRIVSRMGEFYDVMQVDLPDHRGFTGRW